VVAYHLLHELFVTFMMKSDVEDSAVFGHVDQMARGVDKEPPGAGREVLGRNPCGRHAADFLGIGDSAATSLPETFIPAHVVILLGGSALLSSLPPIWCSMISSASASESTQRLVTWVSPKLHWLAASMNGVEPSTCKLRRNISTVP
jgi:hypothetical protein